VSAATLGECDVLLLPKDEDVGDTGSDVDDDHDRDGTHCTIRLGTTKMPEPITKPTSSAALALREVEGLA
jgi:hypothetical protein